MELVVFLVFVFCLFFACYKIYASVKKSQRNQMGDMTSYIENDKEDNSNEL